MAGRCPSCHCFSKGFIQRLSICDARQSLSYCATFSRNRLESCSCSFLHKVCPDQTVDVVLSCQAVQTCLLRHVDRKCLKSPTSLSPFFFLLFQRSLPRSLWRVGFLSLCEHFQFLFVSLYEVRRSSWLPQSFIGEANGLVARPTASCRSRCLVKAMMLGPLCGAPHASSPHLRP